MFLNDRGQSGSREHVLALVTRSHVYTQDSDPMKTSASWAIGLSLFPYANWIESLVHEVDAVDKE